MFLNPKEFQFFFAQLYAIYDHNYFDIVKSEGPKVLQFHADKDQDQLYKDFLKPYLKQPTQVSPLRLCPKSKD